MSAQINWVLQQEEALEEARRSGRLLLVDFFKQG